MLWTGGPEMLDIVKHHISIIGGGPEMLDTIKHHISIVGWSRDVRYSQTSYQHSGVAQRF